MDHKIETPTLRVDGGDRVVHRFGAGQVNCQILDPGAEWAKSVEIGLHLMARTQVLKALLERLDADTGVVAQSGLIK